MTKPSSEPNNYVMPDKLPLKYVLCLFSRLPIPQFWSILLALGGVLSFTFAVGFGVSRIYGAVEKSEYTQQLTLCRGENQKKDSEAKDKEREFKKETQEISSVCSTRIAEQEKRNHALEVEVSQMKSLFLMAKKSKEKLELRFKELEDIVIKLKKTGCRGRR